MKVVARTWIVGNGATFALAFRAMQCFMRRIHALRRARDDGAEVVDLGLHRAHALNVDLSVAFERRDLVIAPLQRFSELGDLDVGRRSGFLGTA